MYSNVTVTLLMSIIPFYTQSMHNRDLVKTSDGYVYDLPQHIIDQSSTLIEKQLLKQRINATSYPTIIPLDKQSFDLFCNACHACNNFNTFFNRLSLEKRSLLTSLAGKEQLNSPSITLNIIDFPNLHSSIFPCFKQQLKVEKMVSYLSNLIIFKKARRKTKKNVFSSKKTSFKRHHMMYFGTAEECCCIPLSLIENNECFFNGKIQPEDNLEVYRKLQNTDKTIYNHYTTANNDLLATFCVTANNTKNKKKQTNTEKKERRLYIIDQYDNIILTKPIVHENKISKTLFSSNANYLVSYSASSNKYCYPTIIVTSINTKNGVSCTDMSLPLTGLKVTQLCFHPSSTVLVTATQEYHHNKPQAKLELWDCNLGKIITSIKHFGKKISLVLFNCDGTRMLTSYYTDDNTYLYTLWDTHNLADISVIHQYSLKKDSITKYPKFNNTGTVLVIPTKKGSLIFINSDNGELIQKNHKQSFMDAFTYIIFTPDDTLCLTASSKRFKKNQDTTYLWDGKTGNLLRSLLTRQNGIRGIGLSRNLQYAVTTCKNDQMISTSLISAHDIQCLEWIKKYASLNQLYALYHAYKAHKNQHPLDPKIIRIFSNLPTKPCNMQQFVRQYLQSSS